MDRRIFITGLIAAGAPPALAEAKPPYAVALVSGGGADGLWDAGVRVMLEPDWKTYWRMPGEAGIPPQFDWQASSNVKSIEVSYPLPGRFADASGETIGYHDEVLFPLRIVALEQQAPVTLKLAMFFAVCRDICIPAKAQAELELGKAPPNSAVEMWRQRVPVAGEGGPIRAATLRLIDGKPFLALDVAREPADIFIESSTSAYFGKPRREGSGAYLLPISNTKDADKLKGQRIKATLAIGPSGIEQTIPIT